LATDLILPAKPRNAQLRTKVVFYKHIATGRYGVGFPDQFPAPPGFEKIVCNHAYEVEKWDKVLRRQEATERERTAEERERVEGPMRDYLRGLLRQGKANGNNINRAFCEESIKRLDAKVEERSNDPVEGVMHVEAFEDGR
jgi:hypothetical protein